MKFIFYILTISLSLLLFSPNLTLASRQQNQTWLQQSNEHFTIIYPMHVSRTAKKILSIAEENFTNVVNSCGYQPRGKLPIVLNHDTDRANAFAQSLFKKIEIFLAPPLTPEFSSNNITWWEKLFLHEYAHLCHGMNDEQGVSWLLSTLFGEVNGLNFIAPRWWVEGIGVYTETQLAKDGRGETSFFQMQLASNLLSKQPWTRAQAAHHPKFSRPWGRIYYLGYDMIKQASLTEPAVIKKISMAQSKWPFWGFGEVWQNALNVSLEKHWEKTLAIKIDEFKRRYQDKGQPMKNGYYLTTSPNSDYQSPRWLDDHRLVVYRNSIETGKAIVEINTNTKQVQEWHSKITLQGHLEWNQDSRQLYYGALEVDPFHAAHFRSQLWSCDDEGKTKPLLNKLRCWSPTKSIHNKMAVINNDQGEAQLLIVNMDQNNELIWTGPTHMSFRTPRFAPNGKMLAAVAAHHGKQDICIIDIDSNSITALCGWDQASDLDPVWSPDGKWLFFVSDRINGVFQLYGWSLSDSTLFKISHAQFGVFQPSISPDGKQVSMIEFQLNHQEQLFVSTLDPLSWEKVDQPDPVVGWLEDDQFKAPLTKNNSLPYQAGPYLWPTFWVPAFDHDQNGLLVGLFSAQRDPLEFHEWQALLLYSFEDSLPFGQLSYTNQIFPITWSITAAREATDQLIILNDGVEAVDWGIRKALKITGQTTIWHHRTGDWATTSSGSFTIGWNNYSSSMPALIEQAAYIQPSLAFGHGYRGPKDLFTIKGWSVTIGGKISLNDEWSTGRELTFGSSHYWPGLFDHHGWRLGIRGMHQLGRFPENNGRYLPNGYQQDINALDYQSTATLSYRLPLWYIDQGWAEWPIFLNDIWMALIYETGASWDKDWQWNKIQKDLQQSLSIEGTLDLTLFWYLTGAIKTHLIYRISDQKWDYGLDFQVRF